MSMEQFFRKTTLDSADANMAARYLCKLSKKKRVPFLKKLEKEAGSDSELRNYVILIKRFIDILDK